MTHAALKDLERSWRTAAVPKPAHILATDPHIPDPDSSAARRVMIQCADELSEALSAMEGEAVNVIVGELVSFVTHIATCHSNRDGTVTLPPSVKSMAASIVERCNLAPLVYTAPPPQQED